MDVVPSVAQCQREHDLPDFRREDGRNPDGDHRQFKGNGCTKSLRPDDVEPDRRRCERRQQQDDAQSADEFGHTRWVAVGSVLIVVVALRAVADVAQHRFFGGAAGKLTLLLGEGFDL